MDPVYQVAPAMCIGFLSGIAIPTLLAVVLWIVVRTLVMAAAGLNTVQDSFGRFLGAPLLSLLVYPRVIPLQSSWLCLELFWHVVVLLTTAPPLH